MKKLLLNAVCYFILLSIFMLIVSALTGIDGSIILRIALSFFFAYYNPLIKSTNA